MQDGRAQHFGAQSHDFKMHTLWNLKEGIFITFVDLFFFLGGNFVSSTPVKGKNTTDYN